MKFHFLRLRLFIVLILFNIQLVFNLYYTLYRTYKGVCLELCIFYSLHYIFGKLESLPLISYQANHGEGIRFKLTAKNWSI